MLTECKTFCFASMSRAIVVLKLLARFSNMPTVLCSRCPVFLVKNHCVPECQEHVPCSLVC